MDGVRALVARPPSTATSREEPPGLGAPSSVSFKRHAYFFLPFCRLGGHLGMTLVGQGAFFFFARARARARTWRPGVWTTQR